MTDPYEDDQNQEHRHVSFHDALLRLRTVAALSNDPKKRRKVVVAAGSVGIVATALAFLRRQRKRH